MSEVAQQLEGGCACGDIRFKVPCLPRRAGLCHCLTCRKAHAAAFYPFAVYARADVEWSGAPHSWESSPGYDRMFCPRCGSRVFAIFGAEVEISVGSLDAPNAIVPQYESWIIRREHWQPALPLPQFDRDRPPSEEH